VTTPSGALQSHLWCGVPGPAKKAKEANRVGSPGLRVVRVLDGPQFKFTFRNSRVIACTDGPLFEGCTRPFDRARAGHTEVKKCGRLIVIPLGGMNGLTPCPITQRLSCESPSQFDAQGLTDFHSMACRQVVGFR
jgi:hypothetical protein